MSAYSTYDGLAIVARNLRCHVFFGSLSLNTNYFGGAARSDWAIRHMYLCSTRTWLTSRESCICSNHQLLWQLVLLLLHLFDSKLPHTHTLCQSPSTVPFQLSSVNSPPQLSSYRLRPDCGEAVLSQQLSQPQQCFAQWPHDHS